MPTSKGKTPADLRCEFVMPHHRECGMRAVDRVYGRIGSLSSWQPFFACDRHRVPLAAALLEAGFEVKRRVS